MSNLSYEANVKLVHKVSQKIFARTEAMNLGFEYDDLFQEVSIVYLQALSKFDPQKGEISTYFTRAAYNWANKLVNKEKHYAIDIKGRSLHQFDSDGSEDHQHELADDSAGQDLIVETIEAVSDVYGRLSDEAKAVADFASEASHIVDREIEMMIANSDLQVQEGYRERHASRPSRLRVALSLLTKVMGYSVRQQKSIWSEVQPLTEYLG